MTRRAWRIARAFALVPALAACGGAQSAGPRAPAGGDGGAVDARTLEAALASAGLERAQDDLTGFLPERATASHAIDVPAGTCLTLAARAATGLRDIDAGLFSPEGDVLAEDVEPDAHPTIQVCGGDAPRRLYLVVRAYDGNGSYRVLVWRGDASTLEAARAVVGGSPGFADAVDGAQGPADTARWEAFAASLERRGFEAYGEPVRVELPADGATLRLPFPVEVGACYTAAAFPVDGGDPVALRAETGWGDAEASSDPDDGFSALQVCPGETAAWVLVVEGKAGRRVVITFHRAPDGRVGGTGGMWLGQPAAEPSPGLAAWQSALADAARAEGFGAFERIASGTLRPGAAESVRVRLRGGRCNLLGVAPSPGLGAVHVSLWSDDGRALGESLPWAERRAGGVAVVCPPRDVSGSLHLVARRGAGAFRAVRAVGPGPAIGGQAARAAGAKGDLGAARIEARRSGGASLEAAVPVEVEADEGARISVLDVAAGSCAEIALLAGEGAYDVALFEAPSEAARSLEALEGREKLAAGRGRYVRLVGCRSEDGLPLVLTARPVGAAVRGVRLVSSKTRP